VQKADDVIGPEAEDCHEDCHDVKQLSKSSLHAIRSGPSGVDVLLEPKSTAMTAG
jgi:hypothetical protein